LSTSIGQIQSDFRDKLLSEALLQNVGIVSLRDIFSMNGGSEDDAAQIQAAYLVWATPRSGKISTGIMVGMPSFKPTNPNTPGPERTVEVPVYIFQDVQMGSYHPNKSGVSAEQLADDVDAILHQLGIEGVGSFYCVANEPDRGFSEDNPGIVARELKFRAEVSREHRAVRPRGPRRSGARNHAYQRHQRRRHLLHAGRYVPRLQCRHRRRARHRHALHDSFHRRQRHHHPLGRLQNRDARQRCRPRHHHMITITNLQSSILNPQ